MLINVEENLNVHLSLHQYNIFCIPKNGIDDHGNPAAFTADLELRITIGGLITCYMIKQRTRIAIYMEDHVGKDDFKWQVYQSPKLKTIEYKAKETHACRCVECGDQDLGNIYRDPDDVKMVQ